MVGVNFLALSYEAVIPINDNTLNAVTVDELNGVTTVWHTLDLDDPTTGLVLVSVYPSENVSLDVYLGFNEQPTEVEYFINLTVRVNSAINPYINILNRNF